MGTDDRDSSWSSQLLVGLGAVLAVALLLGVVGGLVALGTVSFLGLGGPGAKPAARPSLYLPGAASSTGPAAPGSASTSPSPTPSAKPKPLITLQSFPVRVAPGQRIHLTGAYPKGEGATLRVQQFAGGWRDFPVTVGVSGGIFQTYVITSQSGPTRFRVLDSASGRHSNAVRVLIG